MRILGVDLGTRRIGLAVSDPGERLASPAGTIERSGDPAGDHARLAEVVGDLQAEAVVVGLPLSLSGAVGPAARAVLDEVEELKAVLAVPVHTHDERFTTVTAARGLREARPRAGSRAAARSRRQAGRVDEAAAAVLLQAWLDQRRLRP